MTNPDVRCKKVGPITYTITASGFPESPDLRRYENLTDFDAAIKVFTSNG